MPKASFVSHQEDELELLDRNYSLDAMAEIGGSNERLVMDDDNDKPMNKRESSLWDATFNFTNSIIGAGKTSHFLIKFIDKT